jgi:3-hydroxyanthranilate 3,4-dioxygenase
MAISKPFNLTKLMKTVNYLNRPGIKNLYTDSGDYIVMVVAGPNAISIIMRLKNCFINLGFITIITQENGERNVRACR